MEVGRVSPVLAFAAFQMADAAAVAANPPYIQRALDRVNCPPAIRRILPAVKVASGAGLLVGLRTPRVGRATSAALAAYFGTAIGFHLRARDTVAGSLPAFAMLGASVAVGTCFDVKSGGAA